MLETLKIIYETLKSLRKRNNKNVHFETIIAQSQIEKIISKTTALTPTKNSRERAKFKGNPMKVLSFKEIINLIPILVKNMFEIIKSYQGLKKHPHKNSITTEELKTLEKKAKTFGIDTIGYTKIKKNDIFQNRAVLYPYAIVFSIKMNKEDIEKAPSYQSLKTIQDTYLQTGIVANKITNLLRQMGFGAQSGPGLGGQTVYPVLAERAGLGAFGRHGLIITPENGPTHRLGVVYTNITNLPLNEKNHHEWIQDFCQKCGKCIKKCPANAIYKKPQKTRGNNITFINSDKCTSHFENYGCSICIKECPFNKIGYQQIKSSFLN